MLVTSSLTILATMRVLWVLGDVGRRVNVLERAVEKLVDLAKEGYSDLDEEQDEYEDEE